MLSRCHKRTPVLVFQAMPNFHLGIPSSVLLLNALASRHRWDEEISQFTVEVDAHEAPEESASEEQSGSEALPPAGLNAEVHQPAESQTSSVDAATEQEKPAAAPTLRVVSGALETSNLNNVSEMAAMIQNSREFDSLQRNVTILMNDLGRKVASEIGKI